MENVQLERLKAEEAQAEAQAFGNPTVEEHPQEAPATEAATEQKDPMEEIILPAQPEEKKKRTNWKHRFTSYKAATDTTLYEQRMEIADLKQQVAGLMETLGELRSGTQEQGDLFDGVFTKEDEDTFGADGMDVVKKAAKAAVEKATKPLNEKLQKQEKEHIESLKRQSKAAKEAEYAKFLDALEGMVPDYKELNFDPGFAEWMNLPDTYSGLTRAPLFQKAEAAGDVARVAEFFVEYKASLKPQPEAIPEELARHITPVGSGVATPATSVANNKTGVQIIYESEIDKFYSDVTKGRYKGQESVIASIEAQIDKAAMEGRIHKG